MIKKHENKIYIFIISILPFILYGKVLFRNKMLFGTDWLAGTIMQREFFVNMLTKYHTFALWNPLQFAGIPTGEGFFGDIFYLPTLLLKLIFPLYIVWTLIFILHPIVAGIGTYLFLKNKIKNNLIVLFSSIAYMFTSVIISETYGGHDGRIMVASLLPLLIYFLERGFNENRYSLYGLGSLISGLMLLTGHIQSSYYAIVFGIFYIVYLHIENDFHSKNRHYTLLIAIIVGFLISFLNRYAGFIIFAILIMALPQYFDKTCNKKSIKIYLSLILFIVLTGLISSVQYIPIFRFLPFAARGVERTYTYSVSWSMGINEIMDLFFPGFSGININNINTYWGENAFKLHSRYIGILPMIFALGSIFTKNKNSIEKFFTVSFFTILILALGGNTPFYRIFYNVFPYVNKFRAPELIFFLASFSIIILSAFYLDKEEKNQKTMFIITGIIGFLGIMILIAPGFYKSLFSPYIKHFPISNQMIEMKINNITSALNAVKGIVILNLIFIVFAIYGLFYMNKKHIKYFLIIISIVLIFDLWSKENKFIIPIDKPDVYFAKDNIVKELEKEKELYRVFPLMYRNNDYLALYNIQSISGNHPSPFADYQKFINNPTSVMFNPQALLMKPERLKFLNVKYIISQTIPEDTIGYDERSKQVISMYNQLFNNMHFSRYKILGNYMILKNNNYIPRIYAVKKYIVSDNLNKTLEYIDNNNFDWRNTIIIDKQIQMEFNDDLLQYSVSNIVYSPNKVEFNIQTNSNCLVVLSDQYYKAWDCYIDNEKTEILKTNGIFRSIPVKKGSHKIVFKFNNKLQIISLLISLIGFAIITFLILIERFYKHESIGNNTDL